MGLVRYRVVFKYIGGILSILGGALLLTASVSLLLGEVIFLYYIFVGLSSAIFGWYIYRVVPEKELTTPEAAAVASLSFLATSIIGALPFLLINKMPPLNAWFEAMSGLTTTGFSLIDIGTTPESLLFFRALIQWLGGMGFVLITVSLFIISGRPAIVLLKDGLEEKLFPRIARHVQAIVITYLVLTIAGTMLLLLSGLHLFDAICYTLSGISTGGFAIHKNSVGDIPYKWAPQAFTLVMIFGAINFTLYYQAWKAKRNGWKSVLAFSKSPQVLSLFVFITLTASLLYITVEKSGVMEALFLAASAQTTTGYYTINPSRLPAIAMVVLSASMFIGGSLGSTSGGIKLFRLLKLLKNMNRFFLYNLYPKEVVLPGDARGKGVERDGFPAILYVIIIYFFFIFIGSSVFIWRGFDPLSAVFEVTSAVSTVGLSSGIVSPELGGGLKCVLIFLMWAGRLEFFPVLIWAYSFGIRTH